MTKTMIKQQTFDALAKPLLTDEKMAVLKTYTAHGTTDVYTHSLHVARLSQKIGRRLPVHLNERVLIRGALLHDYYLYDWHHTPKESGLHGFTHAARAMKNATNDFQISGREAEVIRTHMWPLNITQVPRSREAWIVCVADKICSLKETLLR